VRRDAANGESILKIRNGKVQCETQGSNKECRADSGSSKMREKRKMGGGGKAIRTSNQNILM